MSECRKLPDRLFGVYRGKVVKHLENGVLKVYIPDVYPLEWASQPDKLPDAEMVVPLLGGNNNGNGVFSYPNIGSFVVCQFLNGDQNLPMVIGATQGGSMAQMKYHEVANELNPSTGKQPSCIHMISAGRSKIKIYEGGTIELRVDGKNGKSSLFTLDQNGNVLVNCDGMFQVNAENIRIAAKNQIAEYAGKNVIVAGKDQIALCGKDIFGSCPDGHASFQTQYRLTEL